MKTWKVTLLLRSESDPNKWDWCELLDEPPSERSDEAGYVDCSADEVQQDGRPLDNKP